MAHRIILAGSKPLAVDAIRALHVHPAFDLVAVVPCPSDDPGERLHPSVRRAAESLGVTVLSGDPRRGPGPDEVRDLRPDIFLSIFYGRIVKPEMISVPRLGTINLHFGLLPEYRGNRPIPWAMINGDTPGFTIHYIDSGIDSGDIILRKEVPAGPDDSAWDVYQAATKSGLDFLLPALAQIADGTAPRVKQDGARAHYYLKGDPFGGHVDWSRSADEIQRFVRAMWFPPFPAARVELNGATLEFAPPVRSVYARTTLPGRLASTSDSLAVECGSGVVQFSRLRIGADLMLASEASARFGLKPGDILPGAVWRIEEWRK